jgi:hypothetical protein
MKYLGHLPQPDPLYGYFKNDILPQLGVAGISPDFRVFNMPGSNHVYIYEELVSRTRLVGKFFDGIAGRTHETAVHHMEREFGNLHYLRSLGFAGYPHYVARPLGRNASLDCVLVEEFCTGEPLDAFLIRAFGVGGGDALFEKLTALAAFLAALHNRTASAEKVDVNRDCAYFDRIMDQLKKWGHIGWDEAEDFHRLKEQWRSRGFMWEDNQVTVHGDVTPANILFGDGLWVIVIDLERMKRADRVFDVGRLAAEIRHFFMLYAGNPWQAEPFIGHFLWEYAGHFPDRQGAFSSITGRIPFHMGMTFLRIARNSWITGPYRRLLLDEARRTLR